MHAILHFLCPARARTFLFQAETVPLQIPLRNHHEEDDMFLGNFQEAYSRALGFEKA
jgi:hypothetical protein